MSFKFSMVCSVVKAVSLISLLLFVVFAQAAVSQETEAQKEGRMKWWTEARFGMFIHWGLMPRPPATNGSRIVSISRTRTIKNISMSSIPTL